MKIRSKLTAAVSTGLMVAGSVAAAAPPVGAATDTPVTVVLTGDVLSIAVDATARTINATAGAVSTTGSTTLGQTVVTDNRAAGLNVTVTASSAADFARTGGGTALLRSYGTVTAGAFTKTGAFGGATAVVTDPATGVLSGTGGIFVLATGLVGTGTLTFSPTLTFNIPAIATVPGTYTGTVTQTAS